MLSNIDNLFSDVIFLVIITSFLLSILILVQFYRFSPIIKVFCIYLIVSTSTEIFAFVLGNLKISNLFLFHIYSLLEYWFLVVFFYLVSTKYGKGFNLWLVLVPGVIFIIFNSLFIQKIDTFNSYSAPLVSFVVMIFCFRFFYTVMDQQADAEINEIKIIIICLLLYYSTALIVLIFSNDLLKIDKDKQFVIWFFKAIITLGTKFIYGSIFIKYLYKVNPKFLKLW